ncbi:MAG: class I SAM-dependent methyltransferase, partial [Corynebacterium flavescens]|nr:class I SAM-dependent methyltransferase [Corynebacterium flavescens]MDN6200033.1 class I SAM-dependent methyltransferase [Corynebacterium flavescens]MDN6227229.1 class I SAM-dependent methyltransferase [Corynebacterium flavescens]MDN6475310.1 class I SAM-dependent methyltransferase [Corynebacterium flavescens]MDN6531584.1 class I SAM-dependent methyltransferase [Corynebacterium flavescens]
PRVRWRMARQLLGEVGLPVHPVRRRLRDNTLTVDWELVAPHL